MCRARPQLVFTFDNRFGSTGWAVTQSVRYINFRLQASYLSATSHTGGKSCWVKSLYMKRFWGVALLYTMGPSVGSNCQRGGMKTEPRPSCQHWVSNGGCFLDGGEDTRIRNASPTYIHFIHTQNIMVRRMGCYC
jgi:hypothetical protein